MRIKGCILQYKKYGDLMLLEIFVYNPFAWMIYAFLLLVALSYRYADDEDMQYMIGTLIVMFIFLIAFSLGIGAVLGQLFWTPPK